MRSIVADSLAGHEQPARQPTLDRMEQSAGCGLRQLLQQHVHVSIHHRTQVAIPWQRRRTSSRGPSASVATSKMTLSVGKYTPLHGLTLVAQNCREPQVHPLAAGEDCVPAAPRQRTSESADSLCICSTPYRSASLLGGIYPAEPVGGANTTRTGGSSNMNTETRFHSGDRPRDLTTIATALRGREGAPNLRLEAAAWRQLAGVLTADPSTALLCALHIALALCRAGTAGLSLLKTDAAAGTTVRWQLVLGALAPYEGLDTPLISSPCGLCLDAGATILVSRPARAFAWLEDTRPSICEELIAPLRDSQGGVEGTLWIAHHDRRSQCSADDVRILEQLAQHIVLALRLQEHARDREHALSVLQSLQAAQQDLLSHDLTQERTRREQAEAAEQEARRALLFKETMIDEVNHRTKNTLQAAASLLSLHARIAPSAEARHALLDSRDRLQLLAEVHAMICAAHDDSQAIHMPQLLQTLCDALASSFGSIRQGVGLELTSEAISLPVDDAVAIVLLSNEAVTNAYKHAFAEGSAGTITVLLQRTPDHALILRIADSGVGADLAHTEGGMGLKLIRILAAQLHGTLQIEGQAGGNAGTRITLTMDRQSAAQLAP